MRYLIVGSRGQLARTFIKTFEERGIEYHAPEESRLDITKSADINQAVGDYRPDVIINCAAYNQVDQAEREGDRAFAVNALGPRYLAVAAERTGATLVHFSSDYLFDGRKETGLYVEEDPVNPLNLYGRSKLTGERHLQDTSDDHLIFRLSWVYGHGTQNFIHKLSEWNRSQEFLKIACDEFSVPTSTSMVVDMTLRSLDAGMRGLYHLTNSGLCSRYEWAVFVLERLGSRKFILPVSMDRFHLPAVRPRFSAMNNAKVQETLGASIEPWEDAVESFLNQEYATYEHK